MSAQLRRRVRSFPSCMSSDARAAADVAESDGHIDTAVPVAATSPWTAHPFSLPAAIKAGGGAATAVGHAPASRLPYDPAIASVLRIFVGDISTLDVDAIVNPTNEGLTSRLGFSQAIFQRAGPLLESEISSMENIRTGDARATPGYELPARRVIHTVGPRFNEKYRFAAENALNQCIRSCLSICVEQDLRSVAIPPISLDSKNAFPFRDACHISFRSVRRFLERFPGRLRDVVLVFPSEKLAKDALPILAAYIPRSVEESASASRLLPVDIGDEFGASISKERMIRLGLPTETAPLPGDPVPVSTPQPTAERDGRLSSLRGSGFSQMQDDPDEQRSAASGLGSTGPAAVRTAVDPVEADYDRMLARSMIFAPFAELERLGFCYVSGTDRQGRSAVVFVAARLRPRAVDLDRAFLFFIHLLDQVVESPYVVVLLQSECTGENKIGLSFLKRSYSSLTRKYKKNLQQLYIVEPTGWTKFVVRVARLFVSGKFWQKLVYCRTQGELFAEERFDVDGLQLPTVGKATGGDAAAAKPAREQQTVGGQQQSL